MDDEEPPLTDAEIAEVQALLHPSAEVQLRELLGPAPEIPHEDARTQWRRALGNVAPEWAVEAAAANGAELFEGEAGDLLLAAVTRCVFEDRGPTLDRLARYLLGKGADRFIVLAVLHGWANHFCAPVPFEEEINAVVLGAA
ncbi:MAG: hypothetical protein WCC53_08250 [Thermoanaerobaculia bacterium]